MSDSETLPTTIIPIENPTILDTELTEQLLEKIPFENGDVLYDPWSNLTTFHDNFPRHLHHDRRSTDTFFEYPKKVDWLIGQPPHVVTQLVKDEKYCFYDLCEWIASQDRVEKGFCLVVNYVSYLSITPNRLEQLANHGFHLKKQVMCNIKAQRGRSFFMMFMKEDVFPTEPSIDYITGCY